MLSSRKSPSGRPGGHTPGSGGGAASGGGGGGGGAASGGGGGAASTGGTPASIIGGGAVVAPQVPPVAPVPCVGTVYTRFGPDSQITLPPSRLMNLYSMACPAGSSTVRVQVG